MFSYAERRRVIDSNPVLRTAQPKLVDKPPEIFSVDELAALLHCGFQHAPRLSRCWQSVRLQGYGTLRLSGLIGRDRSEARTH